MSDDDVVEVEEDELEDEEAPEEEESVASKVERASKKLSEAAAPGATARPEPLSEGDDQPEPVQDYSS